MDTLNQAMELLEQYKEGGGDINAYMNAHQTFMSKGKTSLGLNQWVKTDKPTMDDFNEDNRIVDENFRALGREKATKDGTLQTNLNAEMLNGLRAEVFSASSAYIPIIAPAQPLEIGAYLDFHTVGSQADYDYRISCPQAGEIMLGERVKIPYPQHRDCSKSVKRYKLIPR